MAGRSAWGLAVFFFAVSVKSLEAPPPELLENLEFFKSMDLLMDTEPSVPAPSKAAERPRKEKDHGFQKPH